MRGGGGSKTKKNNENPRTFVEKPRGHRGAGLPEVDRNGTMKLPLAPGTTILTLPARQMAKRIDEEIEAAIPEARDVEMKKMKRMET